MLRTVFMLAFLATSFTVFAQAEATAATKPQCQVTQCQARKASTTTQTATPAPNTATQVAATEAHPSCQGAKAQSTTSSGLPVRLVSFTNQSAASETPKKANCTPSPDCQPKDCNPAACQRSGASTSTKMAARQE